jgi:hypothetical protein
MPKPGTLFIMAALFGIILLAIFRPEPMLAPGPVKPAHAAIADDCFACHMPFKGAVAERCITCHARHASGSSTPGASGWPAARRHSTSNSPPPIAWLATPIMPARR